jgi:hypothetical protein
MRFLTVTFCLLLVLGLAAGVTAQTAPAPPAAPGSSTSNPETKADNPTDRRNDPAPQSPAPTMDRPGATPDKPGAAAPSTPPDVRSGRRSDDSGSALPRSSESTRVFGMNPTAAVLLAGAILVVVILAIVAMTRGAASDTRIDIDRRL